MTQSVDDIINAAQTAAANLNSQAQSAAGAIVPQANQYNPASLPTAANGNAPMLSLEDSVAGLTVDAFLKLKFEGLFVQDNMVPGKIKVRISGATTTPLKACRYGNPANYLRSYNGVTEARTGKAWTESVAEARRIDPKCTGDYDAFEMPFVLVDDLRSLTEPDKVVLEAGKVLGYSSPITGGKAVKEFVKQVLLPMGKDTVVEGYIEIKKMATDKGKWAILNFGNATDWKPVVDTPADAEAA